MGETIERISKGMVKGPSTAESLLLPFGSTAPVEKGDHLYIVFNLMRKKGNLMRNFISKSTSTIGACWFSLMAVIGMEVAAGAEDVFSLASTRRARGQRQREERSMKRTMLGLGIMAIALILASPGLATTMTVKVSEDASIFSANPPSPINNKYLYTGGNSVYSGNYVSLVKFDLTYLKELVEAGGTLTITSLDFIAYTGYYGSNWQGKIRLYIADDDSWTASSVTWDNYYDDNIGAFAPMISYRDINTKTVHKQWTWTILPSLPDETTGYSLDFSDYIYKDVIDDGFITLAIDGTASQYGLAAMEDTDFGSYIQLDYTITGGASAVTVPEASTLLLLGCGMLGLGGLRLRRKV